MFHEYTLRPDAYPKVTRASLWRLAMYLSAILTFFIWMLVLEPETVQQNSILFYSATAFLLFAFVYSTYTTHERGKKFRMITTDHDLRFNSQGNEVVLPYASIERIERTPENVLMIYSHSSTTTPVVFVSDLITDRDILERVLTQHVPITQVEKTALMLRSVPKLLFAYVFITNMTLHFLAQAKWTVIATGAVTGGIIIYSIIVLVNFRKEVRNIRASIMLGVLLLLIVARIVLMFNRS